MESQAFVKKAKKQKMGGILEEQGFLPFIVWEEVGYLLWSGDGSAEMQLQLCFHCSGFAIF